MIKLVFDIYNHQKQAFHLAQVPAKEREKMTFPCQMQRDRVLL
jgi:hypothetical protein